MRGAPALSLVVSTPGGVLVQAVPPDDAGVERAIRALVAAVSALPADAVWVMRVVAPGTVLT